MFSRRDDYIIDVEGQTKQKDKWLPDGSKVIANTNVLAQHASQIIGIMNQRLEYGGVDQLSEYDRR